MSPLFSKLLRVVAGFLGEDKAMSVLERNIKGNGGNLSTFDNSEMKRLLPYILGACRLYVANDAKRDELRQELSKMIA